MDISNVLRLALVWIGLLCGYALATPEPIQSQHVIELDDYAGQSFLQTMVEEDYGIVDHFDDDYDDEYEFASWEKVEYAVKHFDRKNKNRILRMFSYDYGKLRKFTRHLIFDHKTFRPYNIAFKVGQAMRDLRIRGDQYALGQFFAIASGAGTLIYIDENNYYYNIGYEDGEVRSGRSYGATILHSANDASHLMYLRALEGFLEYENDYRQFYQGVMDFLVNTDVSVFSDPTFNKFGEAVLSEYITVYTAELRRHLMRDLHPYRSPWGNDMTEATFLSLFNVTSGLMMLGGELIDEGIEEHWAMSRTGSGRSGFGINRKDRRRLQSMITNFYRYNEDRDKRQVLAKVARLIDLGWYKDVYRGVMEFLNNRRNLADIDRVGEIKSDLAIAFTDFLMAVYEDTDAIMEYINDIEK